MFFVIIVVIIVVVVGLQTVAPKGWTKEINTLSQTPIYTNSRNGERVRAIVRGSTCVYDIHACIILYVHVHVVYVYVHVVNCVELESQLVCVGCTCYT